MNGQPASSVAAVDATTGASLPFVGPITERYIVGPDFGQPAVQSWAFASDGATLFASGPFKVASPARDGLMAVNATTGALQPWNPALAATGFLVPQVRGLGVAGHTVYLGGMFSQVNGQARSDLAAVDATGALTAFNAGFDTNDNRALGEDWSGVYSTRHESVKNDLQSRGIYALNVLGNRLAVGGDFFSIDGTDQSGFGRFEIP